MASSLFVAAILVLALFMFLLGECTFLVSYRSLLLGPYLVPIALYTLCMFVNLVAGFYVISRRLFLKDTGRKLAHLEKQLRSGPSILEELSERLED